MYHLKVSMDNNLLEQDVSNDLIEISFYLCKKFNLLII